MPVSDLWHRRYNWLNRQSPLRLLLLVAGVGCLSCAGCVGISILPSLYQYAFQLTPEDREYRRTRRAISPDGLPSVGRRLKTEMESIPDPDTALQLHPDWDTLRFPNGEWVFGHGISSHDHLRLGSGTQVVKDSRGHVRIFFGHVCGPNGGIGAFHGASSAKSLDDFYRQLSEPFGFHEWVPD
ncbi:hypothetical protein J8F10_25205 [Gemmata sp. G18]|uniref:Lipoprotein n=1 Tax=Gemmata palustris TaxID=2822762 RepID=A0ABS5BXT7_9BACT|nr:hypothetical protein [Gemmata palustris]MBP3958561.1 hypothetical protein [Gemmata palustris]